MCYCLVCRSSRLVAGYIGNSITLPARPRSSQSPTPHGPRNSSMSSGVRLHGQDIAHVTQYTCVWPPCARALGFFESNCFSRESPGKKWIHRYPGTYGHGMPNSDTGRLCRLRSILLARIRAIMAASSRSASLLATSCMPSRLCTSVSFSGKRKVILL